MVEFIKTFKRWGNSLVLVFTKEEEINLKIKKGSTADISDMIIK